MNEEKQKQLESIADRLLEKAAEMNSLANEIYRLIGTGRIDDLANGYDNMGEKELLEMYEATFSGHEQQLILTATATYTRLAKSYEKEEIQAIAEILKALATAPVV